MAASVPTTDTLETELSPKDLTPGMVIARDVRSGTRLLLLSKGTLLDEKNIQALRRCYYLDPSKTGIYVWVKRKQEKTQDRVR